MYRAICDAIHRELDNLEERYTNGAAMTGSDLDMIDKAAHALKCMATYDAMTGGDCDWEPKRRRYESYRRY